MKKVFFGIIALLSFSACEPDFTVQEDSPPVPIVYVLLDKNDGEHIIRITKSFQLGGNAFTSAQNPDSSRIEGIEPVILVKDSDGEVEKTIPLTKKTITGKPEGVFYSGEQEVYAFQENLSSFKTYELTFDYKGKVVSAETPILQVTKNNWETPKSVQQFVGFLRSDQSGDEEFPKFQDIGISFTTNENIGQYEVYAKLPYLNVFTDGTESADTLVYKVATVAVRKEGESKNADLNSETFINAIPDFLTNPANLAYREVADSIVLALVAGGEELATYIEVNNPSTGIIQEKPAYTNVSNGLGIFSTVFQLERSFEMVNPSLQLLTLYGPLNDYKFCTRRLNAYVQARPHMQCPAK